MLGIQNQPQIGQNNSLSFQSRHNDRAYVNYDDDEDFDSFDRKEEAKADRDSAKRQVADDKAEWDNLADELENSDSKVSKKLGKGARFMASAVGLAGTFLVAKCSSKLTIETLKSFAKSKTMASTLETFKSVNDSALLKTYGGQEGVKRAINLGKIRQIGSKVADNGSMVRTDIFRHKSSGKFYGVPIYTMDYALGKLPNKAVVSGKDKAGVIKEWLEMDENYEFCFSLFKDDLLLVQKKEMSKAELCYFVNFVTSNAQINVEKHDNHFTTLTNNQKLLFTNATPQEVRGLSIGIQNLKVFEKWQVSPLGDVKKAEFKKRENISLKSTPKTAKHSMPNSNLEAQ